MSTDDEAPPPPRPTALAEAREEKRVKQVFKDQCWKVIADKWTSVREDCKAHWDGPDAEDCLVEKKIMREHVEVLEHGVVLAVVVFATLRLVAHPKFEVVAERYIRPFFRMTPPKKKADTTATRPIVKSKSFNPANPAGRKKKTADSTTFDSATTKSPKLAQGQQSEYRHKSYLERQRDAHVERIHRASEPFHDMMVSLIAGLSAVFFFMRPSQMRLDFEEAPLCPGRSFWSENMCDDFIKIMQETDPKVFDFAGGEQIDSNLRSFEQFTLHCQLRSAYVKKRTETGEAKPLVLPSSGPWEENHVGNSER